MKKYLSICLMLGFLVLQSQKTKIGSLEFLDPRMEDLIDKNAKIELLAEGFDWAEGPVWVDRLNGVLFSDVPNNKVYMWNEKKGLSIFIEPSGMTNYSPTNKSDGSNGLALDKNGNLILCQHGDRTVARLKKWNFKKPSFDIIVEKYEGKRLNSPNDLVFDKSGSIYFTDPPYGLKIQDDDPLKELNFNGIYRWSESKGIELLSKSMKRPNGIILSEDEKTVYVGNSDKDNNVIIAFDNNKNGLVNERVFFDGNKLSKNRVGLFDGLKLHSSGIIFTTGPGGVLLLDSKGKHLGTIMPGKATANCAFDSDESYLYLTSDNVLARIKLKS
ncbi:gluconolactonase [Bacteroidetes bacterium SCGC AAA795-G10]|nr:gluconolactonase [Bacteroidetes bacterium SCGC AAA795-G10]